MKLTELINLVQTTRPTQYGNDILVGFVNEVEHRAVDEVIDKASPTRLEWEPYKWSTDQQKVLLIPDYHTDVYLSYVYAKIDFTNAETDRYNNDAKMYLNAWNDYAAWYRRNNPPFPLKAIRKQFLYEKISEDGTWLLYDPVHEEWLDSLFPVTGVSVISAEELPSGDIRFNFSDGTHSDVSVDTLRVLVASAEASASTASTAALSAAQDASTASSAATRAEAAAATVENPVSYNAQSKAPWEQDTARNNINAEKKGRATAAADIIMRNGWNQILTGGNFMSDAGWNLNGCTLEIEGVELGRPSGKITALSTGARSIYRDLATKAGHKYFVSYEARYGTAVITRPGTPKCGYGAGTTYRTDVWELTDAYKRYTDVFEAGEGSYVYIYFDAVDDRPMHVRNAMLIDLTEMYGEGNEPTDDEFIDLFPSEYYPVNTRTFGDLLWENATPNAAFSPQTIAADLTAYKCLMVIFTGYSGENKISVVTAKGLWTDATGTKGNSKIIKRAFTSSDAGVQFGKGFLNSTYGSAAEDNTVVIPYRIYGVR